MAQLNYIDTVSLNTLPTAIVGNNSATATVSTETRLFMAKYAHQGTAQLMNGDDLGFTIVFGNFGENTWTQPTPNVATVQDTLTIPSPMRLKLMSLSLPSGYQLWVISRDGVALTNPRQLVRCTTLNAGTYVLQLRQLVNGAYTAFFDVPCHSINVLSMLFQVRFPACPGCPDECSTVGLTNGDFELEPHNTANIITNWAVQLPTTGNPYAQTVSTVTLTNPVSQFQRTYNPVSGSYFALLKTDGPGSYTEASQTIEVCPGDTVQGYSFFFTNESSCNYPDNGRVQIVNSNGTVIATPFTRTAVNNPPAYGSTGWVFWSYTFTQGGIYTLRFGVTNALDSEVDSYLGSDAITVIKNQSI